MWHTVNDCATKGCVDKHGWRTTASYFAWKTLDDGDWFCSACWPDHKAKSEQIASERWRRLCDEVDKEKARKKIRKKIIKLGLSQVTAKQRALSGWD